MGSFLNNNKGITDASSYLVDPKKELGMGSIVKKNDISSSLTNSSSAGMGAVGLASFGVNALAIGMQTGAGIANAQYNANAMRENARAVEDQSNLQAYLIREQYLAEYKALQQQQEMQQSQNRVDQAKYGIRGASADAVMQSYAAKAQKNLEQLYHNAAMDTGKNSLAAMAQKAALLEKARQYDWEATQTAVAGAVKFGSMALNTWSDNNRNERDINPVAALESGTPNTETVNIAEGNWSKIVEGARIGIQSNTNISLGHN